MSRVTKLELVIRTTSETPDFRIDLEICRAASQVIGMDIERVFRDGMKQLTEEAVRGLTELGVIG